MKKLIILFLAYFLLTTAHCQIVDGFFAGGSFASPTSDDSWTAGLDGTIGLMVYQEYNGYTDVQLVAGAQASYNSIYIPNGVKRFMHYQGIIGMTNSDWWFLTVNGGYMNPIGLNANSVFSVSGEAKLILPFDFFNLRAFVSGQIGHFFKPPFIEYPSRSFAIGMIGVKLRLYE